MPMFKAWDRDNKCFLNNFVVDKDGLVWTGFIEESDPFYFDNTVLHKAKKRHLK